MARKRRLLFHRLYSLLRRFRPSNLRRQLLWMLMGTALMLALSEMPGFSQQQVSPSEVSPEEWFQQGQSAYEDQNYSGAVVDLNRAIQGFAAQDNVLEQAIALGNLSLSHQALGHWAPAKDAIETGLALLDIDDNRLSSDTVFHDSSQNLVILAPLLDIDGQLRLKQGDFDAALNRWQTAAEIYERLQNNAGLIANQTRQIQALHGLGLYGQASAISTNLETQLTQLTDPLMLRRSLLSLGNTYRSIGKLACSKDILEHLSAAEGVARLIPSNNTNQTVCLGQILENLAENSLASNTENPQSEVSSTLLSLGNTYLALGNREKERQTNISRQGILPWRCMPQTEVSEAAKLHYRQAIETYRTALRQATSTREQVTIQLNLFDSLLELEEFDPNTQQQWTEINSLISNNSFNDRFGVYARIKLAKQGTCFKQLSTSESLEWEPIIGHLKQASVIAKKVDDKISASQALGSLGSVYEYFDWLERQPKVASPKQAKTNVWHEAALELTKQALVIAQPHEFPDIAYQWQWQLARLHSVAGQIDTAVADYRQTVDTLKLVRNNLLTIDSEVQFSFRDNVEPVYRELVDLLLQPEEPSQDALKEVIGLIDNIQLAELESFLQCNLAGTVELTKADLPDTSAIIYTIILADRLEVIVQIPEVPGYKEKQLSKDKALQHHRVVKTQADLEAKLSSLRKEMSQEFMTLKGQKLATEVYGWLFNASDITLEDTNIDTLVFILDGGLRNVPLATLRNEQGQYLVEKYAIALTPRLQLKKPEPLQQSNLDILFFGLSEISDSFDNQKFGELPFVEQEAQQLPADLPNQIFLNREFNEGVLKERFQSSPAKIVHFATHGEFSSNPEETFVLAWDKKINSNELHTILRSTPFDFSIDLLVLSACQTAKGDNRATLGLAGLALQAGAQSTIASLWTVNDLATAEFTSAFYRALIDRDTPTSRAQALRNAQLELLNKYENRPFFWAPFVLVGNWL